MPSDLTFTDADVSAFRTKMFINGALAVVANVVAIYLIVFRSGRTLGPYKWFLLNIVVSHSALPSRAAQPS